MTFGEVCEHGSLKRNCPHCEIREQDQRIAELEAERELERELDDYIVNGEGDRQMNIICMGVFGLIGLVIGLLLGWWLL